MLMVIMYAHLILLRHCCFKEDTEFHKTWNYPTYVDSGLMSIADIMSVIFRAYDYNNKYCLSFSTTNAPDALSNTYS